MNPIDEAANALDDFASGPVLDAADSLASAFENAGNRIANSLERAAVRGEFSFNSLAESIAQDFARLAVSEFVSAPLQGLTSSLISNAGSSLQGQNAPPVTVNMTVNNPAGSSAFKQSEGQIAARLAQAVSRGQSRI